jgi:hypothetical protein
MLISLSFLAIGILTAITIPFCFLCNKEETAIKTLITYIVIVFIWGLWLGYLHLVPTEQSFNNLCPADQQVAGYCPGGK